MIPIMHRSQSFPVRPCWSRALNIRLTLLTFTFYLFGVYLGVSPPKICHWSNSRLNFIMNNFFERSIKCSLWKSTVVECAYVICTSVKIIFENEQPQYHSDLVIKLTVSFSNKIILLFFLFIRCRSSNYYPDTALPRAIVTRSEQKKNTYNFKIKL